MIVSQLVVLLVVMAFAVLIYDDIGHDSNVATRFNNSACKSKMTTATCMKSAL